MIPRARRAPVVDGLVELLIQVTHRITVKAERRVIEDAVWTPRASQRTDRLLDGEVVGNFLPAVLSQDRSKDCCRLSSDHFAVDGTLLEASASPKSFA